MHVFHLLFNLPHAIVILHLGNKVIRWPVFNATLSSVSDEITAVLNVYGLIVSTCTHPWSREGVFYNSNIH